MFSINANIIIMMVVKKKPLCKFTIIKGLQVGLQPFQFVHIPCLSLRPVLLQSGWSDGLIELVHRYDFFNHSKFNDSALECQVNLAKIQPKCYYITIGCRSGWANPWLELNL